MSFSLEKFKNRVVLAQKWASGKLEEIKNDDHAFGMSELIMGIIALFIVVLLATAIIPSAISGVANTSTTGWGAGAISMWTAIPTIIVLVVFLLILAIAIVVIKKFE